MGYYKVIRACMVNQKYILTPKYFYNFGTATVNDPILL